MIRCAAFFAVCCLLPGLPPPATSQPQEAAGGEGLPAGTGTFRSFAANPMRPFETMDPTKSHAMPLLLRPDVQKELGFSEDQRVVLMTVRNEMVREKMVKYQEKMASLRGLPPAQRLKAMRQAAGPASFALLSFPLGPIDARVDAMLRPDQKKRLFELDIRWRGLLGLSDPIVADLVGVTSAQSGRIEIVLKDYKGALDKLGAAYRQRMLPPVERPQPAPAVRKVAPKPSEFSKSPEQMEKELQQAHKDAEKARETAESRIYSLMTQAQRQTWNGLLGASFDFQKPETVPEKTGGAGN